MLYWAYNIHKFQGNTLDMAVIDLGKGKECSGMNLVALSSVRKLEILFLHPFSFEHLVKVSNY